MTVTTRGLLGAVGLTLLTAGSFTSSAGIAVSPNASDPIYPASMPDPWVIAGPLDLMGSTLSIDNGSSVTADALLNGGVILGSTSGSYTFGDIGFYSGAFATFLDDAMGNTGTFSSNTGNTVSYFGLSNGATFNNTAGGSLGGPLSTTVINLDSGSTFNVTGDISFLGDISSFSLGPGVESTLSATGSGDQNTMVNEVTALVTIAKAKSADRAMNAITAFIDSGGGTGDPSLIPPGVGYTFRVDGNATFAGVSSDVTIYVDPGSSFEVTGNADLATGAGSDLNLVALEGTFDVGGDFSATRNGTSSTNLFFGQSTVTVDGDWLTGDALPTTPGNIIGSSIHTFTADQSSFIIGGHFDTGVGDNSLNSLTLVGVMMDVGGDFVVAGNRRPGDVNGGVSASVGTLAIADSTIEADGSFFSVVGPFSTQIIDIEDSTIDFGGDFIFEAGDPGSDSLGLGGRITQVLTMQRSSFTADNVTFRGIGPDTSGTYSFADTVLDVTDSFVIGNANADTDSDLTAELTNVTGTVGGDFGITGRQTDVTLLNDNGGLLDIAGNMDFTAVEGSILSLTFTGSDLNVGQDFIGLRGAFSDTTQRFSESEVSIGGDYLIGNAMEGFPGASVNSFTADQSSFTIGGHFDAGTGDGSANTLTLTDVMMDIGGDFVVAGNRRPGDVNGGIGGSAAALVINSSTIEADGSFFSVIGPSSIQAFDITDSTIDFGGDFIVEAGNPGSDSLGLGGRSTQDFTMQRSSFTADNVIFRGVDAGNSNTYSMDNIVFDLAGDLVFSDPNSGGDTTIFMEAISGNIGGSFVIEGKGADGITNFAVLDFTAAIGEDLHFNLPSTNNGSAFLIMDNVNTTVGRDLIFDLPTDATGSRTVTFVNVDLDVQRDVVIGVGTDFAVNPTAGELDTGLLIPTKIGRNLVVKGSLDVNDDFSRDSGLAVESTGTVSTSYATPGDGTPVFVEASFTGAATINGGTLNIEQSSGLDTKRYAKATVIAADGGATGAFDTVNAPSFGDNTAFAITYEADGVNAQRAFVGDATLNGGVGLKDFIVVANNRGTEGTWVDGNFDNGLRDVGNNDLDAVAASFGLGTEDAFDAFNDAFSLNVNLDSGLLTLTGIGSLQAFFIGSASGSLDVDEQSDAFEYTLNSSVFGVARGDADAGVNFDGNFYELSERFLQGGQEDLVFAYGQAGSSAYLQGAVSYSRDVTPPPPPPTPPTPPNVIPSPTAALAGLALLGLSMTRRRRA